MILIKRETGVMKRKQLTQIIQNVIKQYYQQYQSTNKQIYNTLSKIITDNKKSIYPLEMSITNSSGKLFKFNVSIDKLYQICKLFKN